MISGKLDRNKHLTLSLARVAAFVELLKPRLSALVVFSSAFGYYLAARGRVDWNTLLMFCIGGFLISGASITINQILEKDLDKLMKRTRNRPLPTGRISVWEAVKFSVALTVVGTLLLVQYTNWLTVALSLLSLVTYSFVYTPMKRVGPLAVLVGAFPGGLPPLLGWAAFSGSVGYEAMIIFGIQFIWQFPHFWAIAWIADRDYRNAGFKLLPFGGKKDLNTAVQIMIYTLFLLPIGLLPAKTGITGINSALIATICGVLFLSQTFLLMKDGSRKSALKIMYSSFLYLPIVQISFLLDMR